MNAPVKPIGFAAMSPEERKAAASRGGKEVHIQGRAHVFTPEEARAAGRKGGIACSADRAAMAERGRKGGLARAENARKKKLAEAKELESE
jgi:uncharacterized protein